jgi:hypothetical protein
LAAVAAFALAPVVEAAGPPLQGLVPANATVHGYTLTDLATSWSAWALDPANEEDCGPSPLDARIWFLPEVTSEGGIPDVACDVPTGTFLVIVPAFWECSDIEDDPFHGENEQELIDCVEDGFTAVATAEVTLDGNSTTHLDGYVRRTRLIDVPPDNVLSPDPGISMTKGIFAVIRPLSAGTHHARIDATYPAYEFEGITDYTITVGRE